MKKRRRKRINFIEKIALPVNDDAKQLKKTWEIKRKQIVKDICKEKKKWKTKTIKWSWSKWLANEKNKFCCK